MDLSLYFNFISLLSAGMWLVFLSLLAGFIKAKFAKDKNYTLFLSSVYAKLFSSVVFSLVYLLYYQGGDTVAYWEGAQSLHNLWEHSFADFWLELFTESSTNSISLRFNNITGYPPGWIYRESESFFVSKLTFFLSMITFRSYLASSLIIAFILSLSSWFLYRTLLQLKLFDPKYLGIIILFTPTVLFWCSGISKDSIVLIFILTFVACTIQLLLLKVRKPIFWILLLISLYIIYQIRTYVLIAFIPSVLMAYSAYLSKKNKDSDFKKRSIKIGFFLASFLVLGIYFQFAGGAASIDNVFNEIIVTQQDFAQNTLYGEKKYDLGLDGYTIPDVIKSTPAALIAAFYRPFPWEALSPLLIFNGLENVALLFLTFLFIRQDMMNKIFIIFNNEVLAFSFFFILIMGFSIGFTSGLFGVLVRFKSIILPFMLLLLTFDYKIKKRTRESEQTA